LFTSILRTIQQKVNVSGLIYRFKLSAHGADRK